jgi:hypothetical protein
VQLEMISLRAWHFFVPHVLEAFCQASRPERREEQLVDHGDGELDYSVTEINK